MATAKFFKGGAKDGLAITAFQQTNAAAGEGNLYVISNEFEVLATGYSNTSGGTAITLAANDIAEVLAISANTWVLGVTLTVVTAGTASMTGDVGLAGGAEFIAATALDAAAGTTVASQATSAGSVAVGGGQFFSTADTIDLQMLVSTPAAGKYRLSAICFSPVV